MGHTLTVVSWVKIGRNISTYLREILSAYQSCSPPKIFFIYSFCYSNLVQYRLNKTEYLYNLSKPHMVPRTIHYYFLQYIFVQ